MSNTDPVEIADIEETTELTAEEMAEVKGGRGPMYQVVGVTGTDTTKTGTGVTNPT